MGFTIIKKEEVVAVEPVSLTVTEKKALTDVFIESSNLEDFYHKTVLAGCHYDRLAITNSYNKKVAINDYVLKLMRGQVLISEAEYELNEDTGENTLVKEAVYNTQPATREILKAEAYLGFPDCAKTAFEYNIDKIIANADGDGSCTFETFKSYFNE